MLGVRPVQWLACTKVLGCDVNILLMGNYFFTHQRGMETKVEYTFGYIQDEEGWLRIQLHHSSMPASTS